MVALYWQRKKIKLSFLLICIILITLYNITISAKSGCWIHLVNISDPIPLEQIKARYTANDKNDGNLTKEIKFQTKYNHLNCEIKEYELLVSVTNTKNITTKQKDKIVVRDFISPTIYANSSTIIVSLDETNIKKIIKDNIIFTDNLDTELFEHNLLIENLPQKLEEGLYTIEIYCFDSSTNKSNTIELNLDIVDNSKSIILDQIINVTKRYSKNSLIDIFKQYYDLSNYKDISIESSYFNTKCKEGIYYVKLTIIKNDNSKEIITFKLNYQENNLFTTSNWIIYALGVCIMTIIIFIIIYKKRN